MYAIRSYYEAESGSFTLRLCGEEWFKDFVDNFRFNTSTCIADLNLHILAGRHIVKIAGVLLGFNYYIAAFSYNFV